MPVARSNPGYGKNVRAFASEGGMDNPQPIPKAKAVVAMDAVHRLNDGGPSRA
jgi:hypothetical protein